MGLFWRMKWADEWVRKGVGPAGNRECARAGYVSWEVQRGAGGAID